MLLMGCALVAALLAALVRGAGGRDARYWAGLAAVLSLLSLDVVVALHERLGGPAAEVLGDATRGPLHFAWVVPGVALALVLGLAFARFVVRLPASTRRLVVAAAAPYLTGAVALEAIRGIVLQSQGDRAAYLLVTAAEEGLEMAGSVLLLYAAMRLLRLRPEPGGGYHVLNSKADESRAGAPSHRSGPTRAPGGDRSNPSVALLRRRRLDRRRALAP